MKITHFAEYLTPGSFFAESYEKELPERTADAALRVMPPEAFAFQLYDVRTQTARLEDGTEVPHTAKENISKLFFPGGIIVAYDDAVREFGENSIIAGNLRHRNGVKTRLGNIMWFSDGDTVL